MEKKTQYLLIVVTVLLVVAGGVSLAYFVASVNSSGDGASVSANTAEVGDTTLVVDGIIDFSDLNIYPGHQNVSKISVTATGDQLVLYHLTWTGTNTLNTPLKYYVYKSTTSEDPSISCTQNREVVDGAYQYYETCRESNFDNLGEVIGSGTIDASATEDIYYLLFNEEIQATSSGEVVYYYVVLEYPNNNNSQNIDIGGSFDGEVNVEITNERVELIADTITNLYPDNQSLVYDDYENLRYIGADPNNYVSFNGELWRIIGVFNEDSHGMGGEQLVKIIRDESIGGYSWDNKPSGTGSSTSSWGSNDWSDSTSQVVLNDGAYWNRTSGTCPYGPNGATTNCDFSSTGLTDEAKAMIETVTWKLGGTASYSSSSNGLASHWYGYERGTTVYSGRPPEWTGEVGLMYPSDYGYATSGGTTTDRETCLATELYHWNSTSYVSSDCYNNDWLLDSSRSQWTITPISSSYGVFAVLSNGRVYDSIAYGTSEVRPSVYLKSGIVISGGTGSSTDPYQLSVY